jgi:hypothetical protein
MIDASFTLAPRQRDTREENKSIKNGEGNNYGMTILTKRNSKTLMFVGQIKMERLFTAIKITQK